MKKTLFVISCVVAGLISTTPAMANQGNPHQEEQDGCDHGATGKPCKADPQPDHGKDCVKHGNHGGINEDHCSSTTTTTTTTTSTTSKPPTTPVPPNTPPPVLLVLPGLLVLQALQWL